MMADAHTKISIQSCCSYEHYLSLLGFQMKHPHAMIQFTLCPSLQFDGVSKKGPFTFHTGTALTELSSVTCGGYVCVFRMLCSLPLGKHSKNRLMSLPWASLAFKQHSLRTKQAHKNTS